MERKTRIIIIISSLSLIFITSMVASYYLIPTEMAEPSSSSENLSANTVVLGENEKGKVSKEGPYGNVKSRTKIAYIIGVHPQETKSHAAVRESVKNQDKSLDKCYYIYQVNVTADADDYVKGRMNGELLAQSLVVPDIKNEKFDLAIDVHSNVGNWKESRFIFSPLPGGEAENIAYTIKDQLPWLEYYIPPYPTSPPYVTRPLTEAGIPALIYETYFQDSYEIMRQHADELVKTVDKLDI